MLEHMLDAAKIAWSEKLKAKGCMSLGELIDALKKFDSKKPVFMSDDNHPAKIDSYRGSYDQLAISTDGQESFGTVGEFVDALESCVGDTFMGYKGGDFVMDRSTPVNFAKWGECGPQVVMVDDQGWCVVIQTWAIAQ